MLTKETTTGCEYIVKGPLIITNLKISELDSRGGNSSA
jgi:hypothetical protein